MTASFSVRALGTTALAAVTEVAALREARAILLRELRAFDLACSRFRSDSELESVNRSAGAPRTVGPLLWAGLEAAVDVARMTGGLVDPTIGRAMRLAGYDRTFSRVQAREAASVTVSFAPAGRWEEIELDGSDRSVRIPPGVELDLGASAKSFAADRIAALLASGTGAGVLVALGGDIATAGPAPSCGWQAHVTDDHRSTPSAPGQTIAIRSGGLATSSTTVRRWIEDGERMHHIIDPKTGRPAKSAWRTVSVAAADCTDANIAATAAILRSQHAPAWLEASKLPARLIAHDGTAVLVGGWPEPQVKESAAA